MLGNAPQTDSDFALKTRKRLGFCQTALGNAGKSAAREVIMINAVFGGLSYANVSAFVSSNGRSLLQSMASIASGRKIMHPSDRPADYFLGSSYNVRAKEYDEIKRRLLQASSVLDVAEGSMSHIIDDLRGMKDLVKEYFLPSTTADEKKFISNTFDNLKYLVSHTIENTVFEDKKLLKDSTANPLVSVSIDPYNLQNKFVISFGAETQVDVDGIDLSLSEDALTSAVQEQIDRAAKYLGSLSGYRIGLNSQININEISGTTLSDAARSILGVDNVDEFMSATKRTIQQQAAISMLAQGNALRTNVLNLIRF